MGKSIPKHVSVSIPRSLILEIDRRRGDVPRSRFFFRMIEKSYSDYLEHGGLQTMNKKSVRDAADQNTGILDSTAPPVP